VTLQYDLTNREDTTIGDVVMDIGDLPAEWTIASATFDDSDRQWSGSDTRGVGLLDFGGDEMILEVQIQLPANASAGKYRIPVTVTAGDATHHQRNASVSVEQPETTPSVVTTPTPLGIG
jgi:hypothetical protein